MGRSREPRRLATRWKRRNPSNSGGCDCSRSAVGVAATREALYPLEGSIRTSPCILAHQNGRPVIDVRFQVFQRGPSLRRQECQHSPEPQPCRAACGEFPQSKSLMWRTSCSGFHASNDRERLGTAAQMLRECCPRRRLSGPRTMQPFARGHRSQGPERARPHSQPGRRDVRMPQHALERETDGRSSLKPGNDHSCSPPPPPKQPAGRMNVCA